MIDSFQKTVVLPTPVAQSRHPCFALQRLCTAIQPSSWQPPPLASTRRYPHDSTRLQGHKSGADCRCRVWCRHLLDSIHPVRYLHRCHLMADPLPQTTVMLRSPDPAGAQKGGESAHDGCD